MKYYVQLNANGTIDSLYETSNPLQGRAGLMEINRSTYNVLVLLDQYGLEEFAQAYKNALFVYHGGQNVIPD